MVKRARKQIIHGKENRAGPNITGGLIAHRRDVSITGVCSILDIDAGRCPTRIQTDAYRRIGAPEVGEKGILDVPLSDVFGRADIHMRTELPIPSGLVSQQVEWR